MVGTKFLAKNTTYYFRQNTYKEGTNGPFVTYTYSIYPSLKTVSSRPVSLSGFTVRGEGNKIKIEWSSASEQNSFYFNVQRSIDAQTWQTISKVNACGNSSSANRYQVYDNSAKLTGTVYYRLAVADKDGSTSYNNIFPFIISNNDVSASLYPNPAHDVSTLQFAGTAGTKYSVTVTNLTGKTVWQKEGMAMQGNNQVLLSVKNLSTGMYFIRLVNGGSIQNLKLIKGE